MTNRNFLNMTGILFALVLTGCQGVVFPSIEETPFIPLNVEVTQLAPQTTEDTRVMQQFTTTQGSENKIVSTVSPTTSLSVTVLSDSLSFQMSPAYFDGFIVLTRYYTLLDHGFFEEVLPLYSSSLLKKSRGKNFESDLKSVEVIAIRPYNYWRAQQGLSPQPIPENEIRYIVGTIVFHKAPAWNKSGTPMPDEQTRFVSLVLEDGEWKLNEINSSPWFQ